MVLNESKTECKINGTTIKVGESVDYKAPTEEKISIGKILQFKHPGYVLEENTESVWMEIQDVEDGNKHWVAVSNWMELNTSKNDTSKEPEIVPEFPF